MFEQQTCLTVNAAQSARGQCARRSELRQHACKHLQSQILLVAQARLPAAPRIQGTADGQLSVFADDRARPRLRGDPGGGSIPVPRSIYADLM